MVNTYVKYHGFQLSGCDFPSNRSNDHWHEKRMKNHGKRRKIYEHLSILTLQKQWKQRFELELKIQKYRRFILFSVPIVGTTDTVCHRSERPSRSCRRSGHSQIHPGLFCWNHHFFGCGQKKITSGIFALFFSMVFHVSQDITGSFILQDLVDHQNLVCRSGHKFKE